MRARSHGFFVGYAFVAHDPVDDIDYVVGNTVFDAWSQVCGYASPSV